MNHHPGGKIGVEPAAYYAAAGSWSRDVEGALRRSRFTAWAVAAAAVAVAVVQGFALLLLMPLKTVVPYAFVVDRQTGYVEVTRPLQPGALADTAAVTQSNLVQYVIARETFDAADLARAYRRTALWSAGKARDDYLRAMRRSDPASPLRAYARTTQVRVVIRSVSLLSRNAALVRFETERSDPGGLPQRRAFAAVIGFRYSSKAMSMGERFDNPLGFEVVSYRRDAEAPAEAPPAPSASTGP